MSNNSEGDQMFSYYLDVLIDLLAELGHFTASCVDKFLMRVFNVKHYEDLFLTLVGVLEDFTNT
jgi:hypothetical protein